MFVGTHRRQPTLPFGRALALALRAQKVALSSRLSLLKPASSSWPLRRALTQQRCRSCVAGGADRVTIQRRVRGRGAVQGVRPLLTQARCATQTAALPLWLWPVWSSRSRKMVSSLKWPQLSQGAACWGRLDPALLAVTTQTEVIASVGNRSDVSSAGTRDPSLRRDGAVSRTPI